MSVFPRIVALSALLASLVAPTARADGADDTDPLDAIKAVAKAKFEAARRTPAERARALIDAAREGLQASIRAYRAGVIPPEQLLAWSPRLLEAELALVDKDADSAPIYERYWRDMREREAIAELRSKVGQAAVTDAAEARAACLQAELDWLSHRRGGDKDPHAPATAEPAEWRNIAADPLAERRNTARDQWEAIQANPRRLSQERVKAARESLPAWLQDFQGGKIAPVPFLWATQRIFDAEFALLERDADPTPLLERRWKALVEIEGVAEAMQRTRKISTYDLANCRSHRLETEVAWIRARTKAEKVGNRLRPASLAAEGDVADDVGWARAKWEAAHADVGTLLRNRLQVARKAYRDADQEFHTGRVTPVLLLEPSFRLLEAEWAAAANQKEQTAVLESYWRRGLKLEAVAEKKLRYGQIGFADVILVRYGRLEAEMWMAAGRPLADDAAPR